MKKKEAAIFEQSLLNWYAKQGRSLPWRETRDPYPILVSEIMLQQTQVSRVLTYFDRWLSAFPSWETLAAATNAEVIQLWSGLGYNRRAIALRDIAKQVVEKGIPQNREEWMELKGIGPYTSAALAVFSLHHRELPIDTNIRRVLGRYALGIQFPQLSDDQPIAETSASTMQTTQKFHLIPQAIFDLATLVCTKKPACEICPLAKTCKSSTAFMQGNVEIPKRTIKKSNEFIHEGKKHPNRIYRGRILKCIANTEGATWNNIKQAIEEPLTSKTDISWLKKLVTALESEKMIVKSHNKYYLFNE